MIAVPRNFWGDHPRRYHKNVLRLLVATGTQFPTRAQKSYIWEYLELLDKPQLVLHGGCIGVDALVCRFYAENYPKVRQTIALPADTSKTDWSFKKSQQFGVEIESWRTDLGYIERNDKMAHEASMYDHPRGIAFPKTRVEELRSGTWATIRRFRKYGIDHLIVPLDGSEPWRVS